MAKERTNKRSVAAGVMAAALAFGVIGGSLAYLQDYTSTIENEFTYGAIDISLAETEVDEYGTPVANGTPVTSGSQEYKLIPGHTYTKDPAVTVEADSEACYVYLVVDNPITALEDSTEGTVAAQIATAGWSTLAASNNGTLYINGVAKTNTQTIYYKAVSASSSDQTLGSFTELNILDDATVSSVGSNSSIDVTAYAVQQDGFSTALDAWEATFGGAPVQNGD